MRLAFCNPQQNSERALENVHKTCKFSKLKKWLCFVPLESLQKSKFRVKTLWILLNSLSSKTLWGHGQNSYSSKYNWKLKELIRKHEIWLQKSPFLSSSAWEKREKNNRTLGVNTFPRPFPLAHFCQIWLFFSSFEAVSLRFSVIFASVHD